MTPETEADVRSTDRLKLSVIVTTFNEEENIRECLESVVWADEVLVVDSYSQDGTLDIAREFPVEILQREYFGSAAQKNWSLDLVAHDWVLVLDADERVPPALAREIMTILAEGPRFNGYYLRRRNMVYDKEIRHSGWSTDKVIRLFHKAKGRYPNRRVHADLEIEGTVPVLKNTLLHFTFRSIGQYFEKLHNYAEWGAAQAFREGRSAGFFELGVRPTWRFIRTYVVQLGFLDGLHGLVICGLQAYGTFLKYARLWDYRTRERRGETVDLPAFDESAATWQLPGDN